MMKAPFALSLLMAAVAFAHCDSLDGPVVKAARQALSSGDVNLVLPWVPADQESTVRSAFVRTSAVRKLNAEAEKLADTWFFETLVRIHRTGENAPYTGLKPAGSDLSPALRMADASLATGHLQSLHRTLGGAVEHGLKQRFSRALELRGHEPADVAAGRRYIAAYVDFLHFAERVEAAVGKPGEEASEHAH